jgi:hypothetical protein
MIFNEDYKSIRPQDYKLVGGGIKKEFLVLQGTLFCLLTRCLVVFIN